ncbi:MAG: hypothetical protein AAF211_14390 [Myxococcota bacterium]
MTLVSRTAFAACSSGVALATVCGLLWLVPRWADHHLETLPRRQAEVAAVRSAWTASQVEGELMRLEAELGPTDARLLAGRRFDEALIGASRAHPDPDRVRTVGRLTTSMRQLSRFEEGTITLATLAAERDRQLEAWSEVAESGIVVEITRALRPVANLADLGAIGGLLGLVVSLWVSATIMWRLEEEVPEPPSPPRAAPRRSPPADRIDLTPYLTPVGTEATLPAALAVIDLGGLVREVVELLEPLASNHGHELEGDVGAELDTFVVDPEQLRAVLEELVEGPLRTSHPGLVTLRARREGRGAVISLVHRQDPDALPTGPRRRGTVLLHDGVEALGGRLWWSADPGDGVRAALWVPDRRFVDGRVVGSALP